MNVVVRFLLDDGSKEVPIAREVFRQEHVEISATVLLESAWVLRSIYKVEREALCAAYVALLSLDTVLMRDEAAMLRALDAHRAGMDLADAMHLYLPEKADEFLTFDRDLEKSARGLADALPVRIPAPRSQERTT